MGSAILFAVACGGKVVVEAGGNGGNGGNGSGGDDVTSTGDVSPVGQVSAVSAVTGGASLCEQVCAAIQMKGCGESGCVEDCQQSYATAGVCAPKLDAVVFCLLNSTNPQCNNPAECEDIIQNYAACIQSQPGDCGADDCSASSDGTCSCTGLCNGSKLEVQCTPGNATDFCTCFKDGTPIGKCTEPQTNGTSCDLLNGCCATVFFP